MPKCGGCGYDGSTLTSGSLTMCFQCWDAHDARRARSVGVSAALDEILAPAAPAEVSR